MKLLRNPVVVGALAFIAVVMVAIQFRPHFMRSGSRPRPETDTPPSATPTPAPQPVASTRPSKPPPGTSIDIQEVESRSARWHTTLLKDPFQARNPATQSTNPPAWDLLKLSAVWRQTQRDLAVINDQIVAEGDRVLDFRVFRIEPDGVWVDGPNGRELIIFASAMSMQTNSVPPAEKPAP